MEGTGVYYPERAVLGSSRANWGKLRLGIDCPRFLKVFSVTGLVKEFSISPTIEEAVIT